MGAYSDGGIVPFQSILLTEELKKKMRIKRAPWRFYHYVLREIFLVAHELNVQGKTATWTASDTGLLRRFYFFWKYGCNLVHK